MAQLTIKGHKTRGKEVIEILEMLGGVNTYKYSGDNEEICFAIGEFTKIIYYNWINNWINNCYEGGFVFTLEEFLERYPYKVGDKAKLDGWPCVITEMSWGYDDVVYSVKGVDFSKRVCSKDLQPYKEEIMKEKLERIKIDIPDGYEFFGINDDKKIVLTKKQPKYPKTYEECCKVMDIDSDNYLSIRNLYCDDGEEVTTKYERDILDELAYLWELKICRDAYWKIARDWEPDWDNEDKRKHVITCQGNNIIKDTYFIKNTILAFPNAEMRDTFFENFKVLIENCKEFL